MAGFIHPHTAPPLPDPVEKFSFCPYCGKDVNDEETKRCRDAEIEVAFKDQPGWIQKEQKEYFESQRGSSEEAWEVFNEESKDLLTLTLEELEKSIIPEEELTEEDKRLRDCFKSGFRKDPEFLTMPDGPWNWEEDSRDQMTKMREDIDKIKEDVNELWERFYVVEIRTSVL